MKVVKIPTTHIPLPHSTEDQRILREKDDVGMMKRSNLWSQYPFLPLENVTTGEIGVLVAVSKYKQHILLTNLWTAKECITVKDLARFPRLAFASFQAMYDAGWRVD